MKVYKSLLILGSFLLPVFSFGFSIPSTYKDGPTVCKEHENQTSTEFSKWVSVPVDYNKPNGEKTLIYAYTKRPFDPKKLTLLYFIGGPGGTARTNEFILPMTNVIYFDQRGIACSRPTTRDQFLNPKFYSSEKTALDAQEILNAYGISTAAIYGHSYGTVPATIFASKFPNRTLTLNLEGVVFKADESLWHSPRKIRSIENYYYSLSPERQKRILDFTARPDVPKNWFSYMGRMMLSIGDINQRFTAFLESTIFDSSPNRELSDDDLANMFNNMAPKVDTTTPEEEFTFGDVTMGMIACQEMNMANPNFSHLLVFQNGHLVPDRLNTERLSFCSPLGLENNNHGYYSAEKYPIKVPVNYFLGEDDPATSVDQGLAHYKNAHSNRKQALIMKLAGHTPNIDQLIEATYCNPKTENCDRYAQQLAEQSLFERLIRAVIITDLDLEKFNSLGAKKWSLFK